MKYNMSLRQTVGKGEISSILEAAVSYVVNLTELCVCLLLSPVDCASRVVNM